MNVDVPIGTLFFINAISVSDFKLTLSSLLTSIFFIASLLINPYIGPIELTPEWAIIVALNLSGLNYIFIINISLLTYLLEVDAWFRGTPLGGY